MKSVIVSDRWQVGGQSSFASFWELEVMQRQSSAFHHQLSSEPFTQHVLSVYAILGVNISPREIKKHYDTVLPSRDLESSRL